MRGLTTHCRRDPRNAKDVGRTVRDSFCTGAQEVGKTCLVRRLRRSTPHGREALDLLSVGPRSAPDTKPRTPGHRKRRLTVAGAVTAEGRPLRVGRPLTFRVDPPQRHTRKTSTTGHKKRRLTTRRAPHPCATYVYTMHKCNRTM